MWGAHGLGFDGGQVTQGLGFRQVSITDALPTYVESRLLLIEVLTDQLQNLVAQLQYIHKDDLQVLVATDYTLFKSLATRIATLERRAANLREYLLP